MVLIEEDTIIISVLGDEISLTSLFPRVIMVGSITGGHGVLGLMS